MTARRLDDLVGVRFGRWLVEAVQSHGSQGYLRCKCDCGVTRDVRVNRLESAESKSCGCLAAENFGKRNTSHGWRPRGKPNLTYGAWIRMRDRCTNEASPSWRRYGGRGITVCAQWETFDRFLTDMGECPRGRSLDRVNNDGNYEPSNCRWATPTEQSNNRNVSRFIAFQGQRKTLAQWSAQLGVNYSTISERLSHGWSIERALTEPVTGRSST